MNSNTTTTDNNITLFYCMKCHWSKEIDGVGVATVNECPNCLTKELYYIRGPGDDVRSEFTANITRTREEMYKLYSRWGTSYNL